VNGRDWLLRGATRVFKFFAGFFLLSNLKNGINLLYRHLPGSKCVWYHRKKPRSKPLGTEFVGWMLLYYGILAMSKEGLFINTCGTSSSVPSFIPLVLWCMLDMPI
jgi:hypothetical protein